MAMRVDDLDVGMYVAVSEYIGGDESESPYAGRRHPRIVFDGKPLRVVALSLPFVGVEVCGAISTIDCREFGLVRLTKEYVRTMQRALDNDGAAPPRGKKRRPEKSDHPKCPRCGCRLRQIQSRLSNYKFHWTCPDCRWDGGPVPAEIIQ